MINRELIRIKVVQLVYAYYLNGDNNLSKAEKELETSLLKAYQLYQYLLALIVAVTREERLRYEVLSQRALREGTELPSAKVAENKFAQQLESNETLCEFMEDQTMNWKEEREFVRKICNMIEQTEVYAEYVQNKEETSYEADREFWRKIYKVVIMNNDDLDALLEEKSLYWNDDKNVIDTFVLKTIKRFEEQEGEKQELLPQFRSEDDKEYALKLFRNTIKNEAQYQEYMTENSRNWELARMPFTDIVIMQTAIAEMATFFEIPVSVTINEYVELSKYYSTPKSASYINGMLDSISKKIR